MYFSALQTIQHTRYAHTPHTRAKGPGGRPVLDLKADQVDGRPQRLPLAEAVEKVGCQVARGFGRFDFAKDGRHQRSSQRPYTPSGQGFRYVCRSLLVNYEEHRPVDKKFRAFGPKSTFSTASARGRHCLSITFKMSVGNRWNSWSSMIAELRNSPIVVRVLVSSIAGVFISSVFVMPFIMAASQYYGYDNDYWFRDFHILEGMARGPVLFLVAFIFMYPLIVITLLVSLIFRTSINKYPAVWSIVAPFSIWLFVCVFVSLTSNNLYYQSHTFLENLATTILQIDGLLYLFGPMPAAAIFYFLTYRRK